MSVSAIVVISVIANYMYQYVIIINKTIFSNYVSHGSERGLDVVSQYQGNIRHQDCPHHH